MNKPQIDEYRLDIVDRLARIESTLASVHRDFTILNLKSKCRMAGYENLKVGWQRFKGLDRL